MPTLLHTLMLKVAFHACKSNLEMRCFDKRLQNTILKRGKDKSLQNLLGMGPMLVDIYDTLI